MKVRIVCFRFDFNPLYCTAMFFEHQLHTYVPLIDLVQLEAFMDSCDITDTVWINKNVPSALGDHSLILLSIFMEKDISFIKGQISSFIGLGNRHLNYIQYSCYVWSVKLWSFDVLLMSHTLCTLVVLIGMSTCLLIHKKNPAHMRFFTL